MAIEVNNLHFGYNSEDILDGISFSVQKGEFVSVIGPNGSGKSTLLRTICGSLKPDTGSICIDGRTVDEYSPAELALRVAWLPQNPVIPEGVTVKEFVAYGRFPHRSWRGANRRRDRSIVAEAIAELGLEKLSNRYLSQLSGGELQRARIAMVIAQEADIIVFDEPTTFLDISHQYEVLSHISRLNSSKSITVLMVVHDLNQAASFSHRILALHEGRIFEDGTPSKVITEETLKKVFGVRSQVMESPFHVVIEGL